MQENVQKISPIKQRILQYVQFIGISKRKFYDKTLISRGTLNNYTGATEETLAKLFAIYKNISAKWLLFGDGSMLKEENYNINQEHTKQKQIENTLLNKELMQLLKEKDSKIIELSEKIGELKFENKQLRNK